MIVAGTGHRPHKLGGYTHAVSASLVQLARIALTEERPEHGISGMALGWDQALAQAFIDLGIPYTAAVPFEGFDRMWPFAAQKRLTELLDQASEVVICHPYPASTVAFQIRNEWMVDRADKMLTLWDGSFGGTFNCIRYAEKRGVPFENLWSRWEMMK